MVSIKLYNPLLFIGLAHEDTGIVMIGRPKSNKVQNGLSSISLTLND
jgi:hypothetical protein